MIQEDQRVAVPALLRQGLAAYREVQGTEQWYKIKDNWKGVSHRFETWQFFILEVLPAFDDFSKLASVFKDRFGHSITIEEVEKLFNMVADMKLFGPNADSHPLVAALRKKEGIRLEETPAAAFQGKTEGSHRGPEGTPSEPQAASPVTDKKQPLGKTDSPASSPRASDSEKPEDVLETKGWHLFDPTRLIKLVYPVLYPFKYTVYLLPAMLITAFFIAYHNYDVMKDDAYVFRIGMKFTKFTYLNHSIIGLVVDNFLATLATALVAYSYGATVKSLFLELHMGFYPRFHVRVGNIKQLTRRQKVWLYSAPLLVRFGAMAVCIFLWYGVRGSESIVASLSLIIAAIILASIFIAGNPLIKSSGYYLLSVALNEPMLRSKTYKAIMNKFSGKSYQKTDNNILVAYGLASALFSVALFVVFISLFGEYVKFQLGGAGAMLVALIVLLLILRLSDKLKRIGEVYERSVQFERWRTRTLPKTDELSATETEAKKNTWITYLQWAIALVIVAGLVVPYDYEPGGNFVILPKEKAELTSENANIIEKVYFDGGEFLKKGTVVAQLSSTDYLGQMKIYDAKVKEQQAVVNDLRSRPRPEEVAVAERALDVQKKRSLFSGEKLARYENLYKEKTISFEELEDQRRQHDVDINQEKESLAKLELVKTGVTQDEIEAAEAKLQSYKEERDYYQEKIRQSSITMPFDGKLEGVNLKQKAGHYLNKGEAFANAENTSEVLAQIEVPEPDIGYVTKEAGTRVRTFTYHSDEDFAGVTTVIDTTVTEKRAGKVVKVLTLLDNKDGRLKSGMTGYAKIAGGKMPAWKVLSRAVVRFFEVDVWSWIP